MTNHPAVDEKLSEIEGAEPDIEQVGATPDLGSTTLSEREKEVLFLAGEGLTDKEIAVRLQIGPKTVRTYWDRMRAKMGAASRTEVLAKALQTAYNELAASEQRVRLFVEHMPVMFNAFDVDWNVILANEEVTRASGYGTEEVLGRPWFTEQEIPDAEERQKVMRALAERQGDFRDIEVEITCKDGEKRRIAWSSRAQQNPIPGWASWAIGIDVTERRRAQEALRMSEESLRRLLETSEQGVWIIDTAHITTFVNQRLATMLATSVEEMVGQPALFREGEEGELLRDILTSSSAGAGRVAFTAKFKRKDGTELWAHATVNPLYTYDGQLTGHAAVLTDVTARKRAEEQRDRAVQAYNSLLNHVSDRIMRFNRDLTCVFANFELDSPKAGESPILEGRSWEDLVRYVKPAKEIAAALKEVLTKGRRTYVAEARIGSDDSTCSIVLVPETGPDGTVTHALAIASSTPAALSPSQTAKAALI